MARILLVEDDRLLAKEIIQVFEEEKFVVTWVTNDQAAYEELIKPGVGLVFLDISLVNSQDGFTILTHIKADPLLKDIPTVMLTNLSPMEEIDRAMDLGADDYVVKALIDLDKLVEIARRFIGY